MMRWWRALPTQMRAVLAGCAGFVVYGGWAYLVNQSADMAVSERAAWVQGSYSFVLTLTMTLMMDFLLGVLRDVRHSAKLTVLITIGFTVTVAAGIHWFAGTPEILLTILPGSVIGLIYAAVYVAAHQRVQAR